MKKGYLKLLSILTLAVMIFATACGSNVDEESYNYISPEDFKARLDAGDLESGDLIVVDSQTEEEFRESHLEGVIATHARPLETDEDFAKLDPALEVIKSSDADVVLICPGGGSGATRPFDYFLENGIDKDRMQILEGGQGAYDEAYPEEITTGYISAEDFKARLDAGDLESGNMIVVDSQTEEEYASSHIEGVIATHARPLETDEDFAKLDPALEVIENSDSDVILICPGGKSGATRPFDYFVANGVDSHRLKILENGQGGFDEAFPDSVVFGE